MNKRFEDYSDSWDSSGALTAANLVQMDQQLNPMWRIDKFTTCEDQESNTHILVYWRTEVRMLTQKVAPKRPGEKPIEVSSESMPPKWQSYRDHTEPFDIGAGSDGKAKDQTVITWAEVNNETFPEEPGPYFVKSNPIDAGAPAGSGVYGLAQWSGQFFVNSKGEPIPGITHFAIKVE